MRISVKDTLTLVTGSSIKTLEAKTKWRRSPFIIATFAAAARIYPGAAKNELCGV